MIANKKEKGKLGNIQWVLNISTTTYWRNRLWNCDHEDCLFAKNSSISISFFCCWNTIQLYNFPHPSSVKFLLSYSVKFVVALTIFESLPKSFFWTDICSGDMPQRIAFFHAGATRFALNYFNILETLLTPNEETLCILP